MTPAEPKIDTDDVQGNVFPGFNKDHQTLRFLGVADVAGARAALADLAPDFSTSSMLLAYADTRALVKAQRGGAPSGLTATWINIALSFSGLQKLAPPNSLRDFGVGAFRVGLAARSALLGDPSAPGAPGAPASWRVGKPGQPAIDVVITVAGDRREDVDSYANALTARLAAHVAPDGGPALRIVLPDLNGDTLGGDLNGHEHFGFKDGVSQPAILGRRLSDNSFITRRVIDPSSSLAALFGRPGQRLLWPGQLLVGQPRQNGSDPLKSIAPEALPAAWLTNGSFMVLRILQQDVPGFWQQMRTYAKALLGRDDDASTTWVAARVVGRWPSGAPVIRSPDVDQPALTTDNRVINDFVFRAASVAPPLAMGQPPLPNLPLGRADPNGTTCPFAGHIRKVNPRDDAVEQGGPNDTLRRLLFRRGVPYGRPLVDPQHDADDGQERGLVFVAYQASIESQFEFLMQNWVNGDDAPRVSGGRDALLGRHIPQDGFSATDMRIADPQGDVKALPQVSDFIVPRGGGYFFAPSLTGIRVLAGLEVST